MLKLNDNFRKIILAKKNAAPAPPKNMELKNQLYHPERERERENAWLCLTANKNARPSLREVHLMK